MTSTLTASVPQVRLPGQVAAHDGPIDMIMMYVMHHAFRRDLAAFADAAPLTPIDARETWRALQTRWTGFADALHHHHSGEDAGLWPLLLERVTATGDPGDRATVEAMETEHAGIDPALQACAFGLARMVEGGSTADRADLTAALVDTRDALGRHLHHEESETIALIQRHLTAADWHRLEKEHFQKKLSLSELAFLIPWACLGLPADVRDRAFAEAGTGFQVLYRLTRGRFDRLQRKAFAYVSAHQ